jgi:hypothetical protein
MGTPSVATARYVLTEEGRKALSEAPRCACAIRFAGLLLVCSDCGTVYGHFTQLAIGGYGRAKPD